MQQLGAGCSWRDRSGDFKANATLKDFGSALEEMPVAALAAMVGVERATWDEKVKKAQAALLLAVGSEYNDTVRMQLQQGQRG